MKDKRNFFVIIGGQRCGSSALFTYLSKHPAIIPSLQKETRFFLDEDYIIKEKSKYKYDGKLETFFKFFDRYKEGNSGDFWYMDSSPDYINCSGTPERIKEFFKNEKLQLVALLRDPIDRFVSWYYYDKQSRNIPSKMTLSQYLEKNLESNPKPPYTRLITGCYSRYLPRYQKFFPDQLSIYRFEHLKKAKNDLIKELLEKMDLDPKLIEEDNKVHNASHEVRFTFFNRIYFYLRHNFQKYIPQNSGMYQSLRKMSKKYQEINFKPLKKQPVDEQILIRLREYYKEEYQFLKTI